MKGPVMVYLVPVVLVLCGVVFLWIGSATEDRRTAAIRLSAGALLALGGFALAALDAVLWLVSVGI